MNKITYLRLIKYILVAMTLCFYILPSKANFNLENFLSNNTPQRSLSVDSAFRLELIQETPTKLRIDFHIAEQHYLYKDRLVFQSPAIQSIQLPEGDIKNDPYFGQVKIFHQDFSAVLYLKSITQQENINIQFQGCSEKGVCYAPVKKIYPLNTAFNKAKLDEHHGENLLDGKRFLQNKGWVIGFFFIGLLFAFTPCTLPMLPVLSNILLNNASHKSSKRQGIILSFTYVFGMVMTYCMMGIMASLSGQWLGVLLQNPWIWVLTALYFLINALLLLGGNKLLHWQNKLTNRIHKTKIYKQSTKVIKRIAMLLPPIKKREGVLGVLIMGALSALVLSPCISAPLVTIFLYISQTNDVMIGSLAFLFLALGMGTPLLIMGISLNKWLPKPGKWMNLIKRLLGFLMLIMAIYILKPFWGEVFLTQSHATFQRISEETDLTTQIQQAKGKKVIIEFYADWCAYCIQMEKTSFQDKTVQALWQDMVKLQIDLTQNKKEMTAVMNQYNIIGPPALIFIDENGRLRDDLTLVGYQDSLVLQKTLEKFRQLKK